MLTAHKLYSWTNITYHYNDVDYDNDGGCDADDDDDDKVSCRILRVRPNY